MRGNYTIDEIRNIVTPIAQQYGVDSLYLFGSYAKGIANEKAISMYTLIKVKSARCLRSPVFALHWRMH